MPQHARLREPRNRLLERVKGKKERWKKKRKGENQYSAAKTIVEASSSSQASSTAPSANFPSTSPDVPEAELAAPSKSSETPLKISALTSEPACHLTVVEDPGHPNARTAPSVHDGASTSPATGGEPALGEQEKAMKGIFPGGLLRQLLLTLPRVVGRRYCKD